MLSILCLNGPNLDRLGMREVGVYGTGTLADLEAQVEAWGAQLEVEVECRQSNHEGELVAAIHAGSDYDGVVFNPGSLTHTSTTLHDAIAACSAPVVEVHISNVRSRDRWRRRSFVSPVAVGSIIGRGRQGYRDALRLLTLRQRWPVETIRYGPHPDQVFDLRRVPDAQLGAVLIHGGFWLDAWGRDTLDGWAVDLAERGIASASIEYRRMGSGGGPLATMADAHEATSSAITALGTPRHFMLGHSAGAHLTACLASIGQLTPEMTIAVSGIFDLTTAPELGDGAVGRFSPDGEPSPMSMPPPATPMVLLHGREDPVVPSEQSSRFADFVAAAGGSVSLDLLPGVRHFEFLDVTSPSWQRVVSYFPGPTLSDAGRE